MDSASTFLGFWVSGDGNIRRRRTAFFPLMPPAAVLGRTAGEVQTGVDFMFFAGEPRERGNPTQNKA